MKRTANFFVYWEITEEPNRFLVQLKQDVAKDEIIVMMTREFDDKSKAKDYFHKMLHQHIRPYTAYRVKKQLRELQSK